MFLFSILLSNACFCDINDIRDTANTIWSYETQLTFKKGGVIWLN